MSAQPPDPSLKPTLPGMLRGQLSSYVARREPRVGGLLFIPPALCASQRASCIGAFEAGGSGTRAERGGRQSAALVTPRSTAEQESQR